MVLSTDQIKKETSSDNVTVDSYPKLTQTGNIRYENGLDNVMETDTAIATDNATETGNAMETENAMETHDVKNIRTEIDMVRNQKCDSGKHRRNSHDRHSPVHQRQREQTETHNNREDNSGPCRKLTNFSIDQILRSDFGPKRSDRHDNGVRRFPSQSLQSALPFPSSSFFSTIGVSSRLPSKVLSAFSSAPTSAFVSRRPPSKPVKDKHCGPNCLTSSPASPESSSSSFSSPSASSSPHLAPTSLHSKKETSSTPHVSVTSAGKSSSDARGLKSNPDSSAGQQQLPWPAWVYCTRYSDRPSSGPRYRKPRQGKPTDKRPRTAFSSSQLQTLRAHFNDCPYLSESRRISLARELGLSESQVKIWFQNKRAKLKKGCGVRNPLAQLLMEEGLYNHSTIVVRDSDSDSNNSGAKIGAGK